MLCARMAAATLLLLWLPFCLATPPPRGLAESQSNTYSRRRYSARFNAHVGRHKQVDQYPDPGLGLDHMYNGAMVMLATELVVFGCPLKPEKYKVLDLIVKGLCAIFVVGLGLYVLIGPFCMFGAWVWFGGALASMPVCFGFLFGLALLMAKYELNIYTLCCVVARGVERCWRTEGPFATPGQVQPQVATPPQIATLPQGADSDPAECERADEASLSNEPAEDPTARQPAVLCRVAGAKSWPTVDAPPMLLFGRARTAPVKGGSAQECDQGDGGEGNAVGGMEQV